MSSMNPGLTLPSFEASTFARCRRFVLAAIVVLLIAPGLVHADFCADALVLDGSEKVLSYGLDTTKNWWAVTSPYDSLYRLWVNGKQTEAFQTIQGLRFSPDGEHWAAWALHNNQWRLLDDGSERIVQCTQPGEVFFGSLNSRLLYSIIEGSQEVLYVQKQKYVMLGRVGPIVISPMADNVAYVCTQAGLKYLYVNGKQISGFDDVKIFGFWTDGQLVYANLSGSQWRIYRGDEELAGPYAEIPEVAINHSGTVAAAIVGNGGLRQVVLLADEYTRPLFSQQYQYLDALVLHPSMPMWAARSQQSGAGLVIMTNTEYSAGSVGTGMPFFSADGSELIFVGCDSECFISINGKKNLLNQSLSIDGSFARKPSSGTFSYSSSTSLIFREIERNELWVSKMCDEVSLPRYNRRNDRYEALGKINQRLYLLSCMK